MEYEWFLTLADKANIATYCHGDRRRKTLTTRLLSPVWEYAAGHIPITVAPNVITLAGFTCTLQAYYLTYFHINKNSSVVTLTAMFLIALYMALNNIDGVHARRTRNASPVGDLFKKACDNIGCVFVVLTLLSVMGINGGTTAWYIVQTAQLVFMIEQMRGWMAPHGDMAYGIFSGPGEAIILILFVLGVRACLGLGFIYKHYVHGMKFFIIPYVVQNFVHTDVWDEGNPDSIGQDTVQWSYYLATGVTLMMAMRLGNERSRFSLIVCICYRMIPAILIKVMGDESEANTDLQTVICDGLFLSVLTTDIVVANRAKRRIHPWVVLMCMASIFNNFIILALTAFYYVTIIAELCHYMNLPLLTINTNVYCDGVYDLCHKGHKNLFQAALSFGNRLHVGVMSDEDCMQYKRKPIMTTEERCKEVDSCKAVYKAISLPDDYSKTGLTKEFIRKHNIHIVAHGWEYDPANPTFAKRLAAGETDYYGIPRSMDICRTFPRTEGISTSDLIKRIVSRANEFT
mmetsp:Transcript_45493/g.73295  ORF Transcript_45493/g.73295 Transcript_45493/m.73295 type:complete len:516 (-) Transcript_45493:344-1891(-)|eukprot:CAMPEP_0179436758 /NCGR_PEP_ID=MMETSP0799-20121207/20734_1 /TAXON_ID=46947 /ORGANISM="Geminigera cryophila, Strain CCMP2564" /LENGTH=515 /DNA_ID=CAMNT_0021217181 /DNA_START=155 /DNA_END=1702 /DNA_ORIENTATION=-